MKTIKEADKLIRQINRAVSPWHLVDNLADELEQAGYRELDPALPWQLDCGNGYYVRAFGSSMIAFRVNPHMKFLDSFRIGAAHTDWPCLRIKPEPEIEEGKYGKVNIEVYGSPILSTWLDRPLSAAGRVTLRGEDIFSPVTQLIDFDENLFLVPNLAIHMSREINGAAQLNPQTDMLPLLTLLEEELNKDHYFVNMLAKKLQVVPEDILFYELCVYNRDRAEYVGMNREFISAPRLDNVTSCQALVHGLLNSSRPDGIDLIALFDNEEVGSQTKQGADSALLPMICEKIMYAFNPSREVYINSLLGGMLLSVDVAHALHPNHPEKHDVSNKTWLNSGVVIKTSSVQGYATDGPAIGVIRELCRRYQIPCQMFANRSDIRGGRTLGSLVSAVSAMRTADVGIPLLAMHSARETMGVQDMEALTRLVQSFFSAV